jgi:hypothetical protein
LEKIVNFQQAEFGCSNAVTILHKKTHSFEWVLYLFKLVPEGQNSVEFAGVLHR